MSRRDIVLKPMPDDWPLARQCKPPTLDEIEKTVLLTYSTPLK